MQSNFIKFRFSNTLTNTTLLSGCLELCVSVNDSVAGICDLISAVGKRNEDEWREKALVQIKEKVLQ